ncbi:hypothetical protein THAOC_34213 [Thalassiosira oceanica]|uniref:Uncharacterized protein n=1 Tax=Thalassiosira oceanica TaxID=159749 RepID=K0RK68_THAOC|nr:hypothetical protein THAOC_34213 [Thalassiosira oceanica]|eukprot:EJK47092.1 hypothetical protein THAOC_34213 [Thalassiosira oceanica]
MNPSTSLFLILSGQSLALLAKGFSRGSSPPSFATTRMRRSMSAEETESANTPPIDHDLTDRFKYKVHALMNSVLLPTHGKTSEGTIDDETQDGNILGAMLQVEQCLVSSLGTDESVEIRSIPRGKHFTRVCATITVDSSAQIQSLYDDLGRIKETVMKF